MKIGILGKLAVFSIMAAALVSSAADVPKKAKWLVLDKITYQIGVDPVAFEGIDALLLTKLAQSKYKVLDRDAYETAAREEGFGANVELVPAGYSVRGEIVQMLKSGKSLPRAGAVSEEYVATVSLRVNDLRTQEAYEAETLRVSAICQTPKDMLVHVVQRTALAVLMREYPPYVMDVDEDDGEVTVSYGADFVKVGERYQVRRCKKLVDDDNGDTVRSEKPVGEVEITSVGHKTSMAKLLSGKVRGKDVLRFMADGDEPSPSISPHGPKPRIAVAPFISKRNQAEVRGLHISTRNWMDDAASHLCASLTQCESFKVLDRSFGPEIDRELDRIVNEPNANPDDVCRLFKKLATDYLVVAEVVFSDVASPGTDYATGRPLPPASAIFAEVRFRCVYAPTTQIKWADVVRMDSMYFGGTAEQFSSASAESAAQTVAAMIQSRLDPEGYKRVMATRPATPPPPPANPVTPSSGISVGF